ncbi:MAG: rubrerythrin family protein [Desulfovibrio sp.]|nr:rubrerythrin family protein [Desulfovibrio sp.]
MKSLKGTQTEKNILTAFSGESQARNRYDIFASKAKKDGYILVEEIFRETAHQEKEHAERLWKFLEGGLVEIHGTFPAGVTTDTVLNLGEAAAGEHEEWYDMYPSMAKTAEQEGFKDVAATMRNIAIAEKFHEKRYLDLQKWIQDGTMFKSPQPVKWRCLNCSCIVEGVEPPAFCPACQHPAGYFVRMDLQF